MKYEINNQLLKEIVVYLSTKPYQEVAGLLNAINNKELVNAIGEEQATTPEEVKEGGN